MQIELIRRASARRGEHFVGGLARSCGAALALALVVGLDGLSPAWADDNSKVVLDAPAMLGGRKDAAAPVTATAVAGDHTRTRFVIGLEKSVDFQVSSLPNPNRVIVDLPDLKVQLPALPAGGPIGLIKSFRWGLTAPGKTSVVIDVTGPVIVEKATIEKGEGNLRPRLVLEIVPAEPGTKPTKTSAKTFFGMISGLGATGVQPPMPRPAQRPNEQAANVFKPTIVIDPGHGGQDSGATRNGAVEKNVVLAFSLKLRDKLQATGRYKVLMTRLDDTFVDLDERRAFADRSKAVLFIAVHADDSGGNPNARGATIYSLRDTTANELQRAAKSHMSQEVLSNGELEKVKTAEADVGAVKGFLTDLALKELAVNKERTKVFAGAVVETMGETTSMMNNPDREAGFRVLKSAKMPSVLIELAYVTNRADASNLNSTEWRDKVSGSILTAVDNYFSHRGSRLPM